MKITKEFIKNLPEFSYCSFEDTEGALYKSSNAFFFLSNDDCWDGAYCKLREQKGFSYSWALCLNDVKDAVNAGRLILKNDCCKIGEL
jgi:hypothetical protein